MHSSAYPRIQERYCLEGHSGIVGSIVFLPDGEKALSGGWDGTLRLWDTTIGKEMQCIKVKSTISSIAVTPDGHMALVGSGDGILRLIDLELGKSNYLGRDLDVVWCVAVSPDGKRAISGGKDKTLLLWDISAGRQILELKGHTDKIKFAFFLSDHIALSGGDTTLRLWDLTSGRELRKMDQKYYVTSLAVSACGDIAISGGTDSRLHIWDLKRGCETRCLLGHTHYVDALAILPEENIAIAGDANNDIRFWDIYTGRELGWRQHAFGTMGGIAISPDKHTALITAIDSTLRIWEIRYPKSQKTYYTFPCVSRIKKLEQAIDIQEKVQQMLQDISNLLLINQQSQAYTLLREVQSFPGYERDPKIISLLSQSGTKGTRICIRDSWLLDHIKGGQRLREIAFSPDGNRIIFGSDDFALHLWDLTERGSPRSLGFAGWIRALAISWDGNKAVSGNPQGIIHIWDLHDGKHLYSLSLNFAR